VLFEDFDDDDLPWRDVLADMSNTTWEERGNAKVSNYCGSLDAFTAPRLCPSERPDLDITGFKRRLIYSVHMLGRKRNVPH
jgi:hypothetical protein